MREYIFMFYGHLARELFYQMIIIIFNVCSFLDGSCKCACIVFGRLLFQCGLWMLCIVQTVVANVANGIESGNNLKKETKTAIEINHMRTAAVQTVNRMNETKDLVVKVETVELNTENCKTNNMPR